MLQLHKLPIFQWLEILHLAQAMLVNWGWVSFPRLLQFCGLAMATYDFQQGCQREVRILRSFSGPSACRHYHFCSLPRAAMSHHPEWRGVWRTTHKAVIMWKVQVDSEDELKILLKENGFEALDSLPASRLHAPLVILLRCGNRSSLLPFVGSWDEFDSGPSGLSLSSLCLSGQGKKMKHLGVLFIFEWLRAPGAF